jgi:hypothetical protein
MDDEPLDIDDRSGGERLMASARVGVNRVGELVDEQRLDFVALLWVVCTVASTGVQIYRAVDLFGETEPDTWGKLAALGQTAGATVAISCLIGIALALTSDTAVSRLAILLAGGVGAWVFAAGMFSFASSLHHENGGAPNVFGQGNRVAGGIGGLAVAGFGLVVAMLAWRAGGERTRSAGEIS